ncbi:GNAT family N-acetyltransferase [Rhodococcus sp. NPDC059234]|uniref:GNAT family N-acetyltransferase n=1 Tax=Rhodococcus sp. NPDC059234 TaxID=3346781 RepID=UPI00366AB62C
MTITVRRSVASDRRAILALMQASRGEDLSPEERSKQGFVQGSMDDATLARLQEAPGVFVAEEAGSLAGFAMTSAPGMFASGPPRETVDAVAAAVPAGTRLFLYGPVAVDPRFQGRGVMTALLTGLSRDLAECYDLGAAFIEVANAKSLAVHRHYGMGEVARFTVGAREYVVFAFDPAAFATRTG